MFTKHENTKKRVLEAFLETAKIALKGRSKKFQYLLSDMSTRIMDIDGDEFAEADYGLVVDNSNGIQELNSKLDTLAQAALQNQTLSFSTIMKLFSSSSLAEKQRLVERDEQAIQERNAQAQQQELEAQQQVAQIEAEQKQAELQQKEQANIRDNETKIMIAQIQMSNKADNSDGIVEQEFSEEARANLMEKIREIDERLKLDKERLAFDREKARTDSKLKRQQINRKPNSSNK